MSYYGYSNKGLGFVFNSSTFDAVKDVQNRIEEKQSQALRYSKDLTERIIELRTAITHLKGKSRTKIEDAYLGLYQNEYKKLTNESQDIKKRWTWIGNYKRKRTEAENCIRNGNMYNTTVEQCSVFSNGGTNTNFPTPTNTGGGANSKGDISITPLPIPVTTTNVSSGGYPIKLPVTTTTTSTEATSKANPPIPLDNKGDTSPVMSFYEKNKTGVLVTGGVLAVLVVGGGVWYANRPKKRGQKKKDSYNQKK
ncbi:hypothetical protein ACE193_15190 [Bernardetia sp. OM2101]|uniref:hypothetical protein n=1 Tax=Bernardetia sp. OM2101 TaxID=3344876 RepID=UPI0035CF7746